ncbi:sushi, von Willebrand factor type A, EGF and pentraxin domain-containing protein 1-like isoform X2 [Ruditapes philippinarum]|uniref:sushi, von Willebrand factor type A, EGF and pentraxin domain-containing protein 1-like isoform X2 n=1 Tax=Ruditapes philippinarum TaxID=129788 RepID=UPI00295C23B5|nr:sushi, von Willebrand factor type A, EGF and pentraxin domain-containing protein 1-like isoform X2 [Ruditapes philippinarum]
MAAKVILFIILYEISSARADCNSIPSIDNTKNNATGSGPFADGTVIRFDCEIGFNPAGTSREYRCSGTQWVDGNLRCEEIFCSHVETPENGKVVNVPTYRVGTTIQFECNEGYDMVGSSNKMLCRIDGNWLPLEPPVCNIKMCGEFGSIQFGETFQDNSYIIRNGYGSITEVTCDEGYIIKGSPHVKCRADGTWGTKPTCELSTCPPYPGLSSSCIRDANPFGPYLFINCRDDVPVTKTGPAQAECISGAWDYLNLACYCHCKVEADSQTMSLQNVVNGYLVHDKTLEWSCKNGYEKKMPDTFHCFDGNLIKPECIIKYKPTVKPPVSNSPGLLTILLPVAGAVILVVSVLIICYCVPYCKKNCFCIGNSDGNCELNKNCILYRSLCFKEKTKCVKCGNEKEKCQCVKMVEANGDVDGDGDAV